MKINVLIWLSLLSCLTIIGFQFITAEQTSIIPSWIKSNAKWWAEGTISDSDFISGIKYLIEKKILILSSPQLQNVPSIVILTNKTQYSMGEKIDIIIKNIGSETIIFPDTSYNFAISYGEKIVFSKSVAATMEVKFEPGQNKTFVWNQKFYNIDNSVYEQAKPGKYKILIVYGSENYNVRYEATKLIKIIE